MKFPTTKGDKQDSTNQRMKSLNNEIRQKAIFHTDDDNPTLQLFGDKLKISPISEIATGCEA